MYDNYNYPMGADTPDAPWNQSEPEPKTITLDVEQCFARNVDVDTPYYWADEEGDPDFDESNEALKTAFDDNGYWTVTDLLKKFRDILEPIKDGHIPNLNKAEASLIQKEIEAWLDSIYDDIIRKEK